MVFTAWVVASVSVWWVPAYLLLLVLIFAAPHGRHPATSVADGAAESVAVGFTDFAHSLRSVRADGAERTMLSLGRTQA